MKEPPLPLKLLVGAGGCLCGGASVAAATHGWTPLSLLHAALLLLFGLSWARLGLGGRRFALAAAVSAGLALLLDARVSSLPPLAVSALSIAGGLAVLFGPLPGRERRSP